MIAEKSKIEDSLTEEGRITKESIFQGAFSYFLMIAL
jgi:hypothetical protein